MKDLHITFGAMAKPIAEQLRNRGIAAGSAVIAHAQKDADAITRLTGRNLIGDTDARKVRQRIIRSLARWCSRIE